MSAKRGGGERTLPISTMNPVVSICMPHLNSQPFTEERMETIVRQTLRDWELIIVDSNSDDGSREVLERYASADPRIRLVEAPRDGIYTNLNRALKLCSGEYVYIATSDDTMTPNCLEQMVESLERNPDCGLCHCCLEIIDTNGRAAEETNAWENWDRQKNCFGEWIRIHHVRRAPHDGILHFGWGTVYTSLTQLLVRRRVFEELGLFRTDCSSYADFEWGMRVGLTENVVHLPRKLATWRRHTRQATQTTEMLRMRARGEFHRLVGNALQSLQARDPKLARALRRSDLNRFYLVDECHLRRLLSDSVFSKLSETVGFVLRHPFFSAQWLLHKIFHEEGIIGDFGEAVRQEFAKLDLTNLLQRLEPWQEGQGIENGKRGKPKVLEKMNSASNSAVR
jgi:glycosyltransferase involved in cell wall biosynthesis